MTVAGHLSIINWFKPVQCTSTHTM